MRRVASIIQLRPEKAQEYLELHAAVWPGVEQRLRDSNVTNYSIFLRDGVLFAYYEYVGDDFDADMAALSADPTTRDWWKLTDPCQQPLPTAGAGERWVEATEVYHLPERRETAAHPVDGAQH